MTLSLDQIAALILDNAYFDCTIADMNDDLRDWSDRCGAYTVADHLHDDALYGIIDPLDICAYLHHLGIDNSDPANMPA